jgi:aromatic amino acid aminotransferase I / 2-aminoadipate transaminase
MTPPPAAIEVEALTDTEGTTTLDPFALPLKVNQVHGRRKKQDKAKWGVAAPSSSAQFKSTTSLKNKPKSKRWDHLLSEESLSRKGSSLKQAARFLGKSGLISLGGGLPSSEYFPFAELSIKVPNPPHFSEQETDVLGEVLVSGKHDLVEDKSIFDISTAFNYGQGSGAAQLLRWVTEHTELVHSPPYADWACNLTIGSTSALDMALRMFCKRGDYIISEEYSFASAVETAAPMGIKFAGVKMDDEGLLPDELDNFLRTWDPSKRNGAPRPHLLYTVPTGQNPTGATQGAARRKQIYRVCQKHDVYILEDEPYYFLQMQPYTGIEAQDAPLPKSHDDFLKNLVTSYLRIDVDGRVMRMDSFSKIISPGSRTGWITASDQIIERYKMHADVSTQCPSGISQLVLFKLLDEYWGHEGFLDWLMHLRLSYTARRDVILRACEKYLPRSVVSWKPPMAGMFHWMQIDFTKHPSVGTKTLREIEEDIFNRVIEHGALVMRGSWFYAEHDVEHDTMFFRATYAAAPAEKIDEAIRRFGVAVRESFGLKEANGHAV